MSDRRPKTDYHGTDEGPNIVRVQLVTPLMHSTGSGGDQVWVPGGLATAKIVHWYGPPDYEWESMDEHVPDKYLVGEAEIQVVDPLELAFGFEEEWLWVVFKRDSGKFEVFQSHGLDRVGKTDASHAKNATGKISLHTNFARSADYGRNISANNSFGDLATSKAVRCLWDRAIGGWDIYAGDCSA